METGPDTSPDLGASPRTGIRRPTDSNEAGRTYAEAIADTVRDALLVLTPDLHVRSANRSFYQFFDLGPEQTVDRSIYQLGDGQLDIPEIRSLLEGDLPKSGRVDEVEVSHAFNGIGPRTLMVKARRLDHDELILIAFQDVTAEREDHRALQQLSETLQEHAREWQESEARYRSLFDSIDAGFCLIEVIFDEADRPVDYVFLEANPAFERHTGLEGAVGRNVRSLVPDLDASWFEIYGKVARSGEPIRFANHAPAMRRWFDVYAFPPLPGPGTQVALLFTDITENRETEAALRRSEQRFRGTFENAAVGIGHVGVDGSWLRVNERLCKILGYTRGELLETTFDEITYPSDWTSEIQEFERLLTGDASHYQVEKRYIRKDDEPIWINVTVSLIETSTDEMDYFIAVVEDITERKNAEEALRRSERNFRLMADTAPAMLWVTGTDNLCTLLSRGWYEYTGQEVDEGLGFGWLNAVHPEDREIVAAEFMAAAAERKSFSLDMRLRRPDGTYRWVVDQGRPRFDEDGEWLGYIGSVIDVHERRLTTEALRESEQKLLELSRSLEHRVARRTAQLRDQTQRLRRLAAELASAEQRERKRLAALLHDGLQQLLFAAGIQLEAVRDEVVAEPAAAALERAIGHINDSLAAARDLTRQLRPPALYEAGLVPALKWLADEMAERHRLRVAVDAGDVQATLSDDVKALLFECVRELLFNVVKYAEIDEASVRLREEGGRFLLVVEDAGQGFDPEAVDGDYRQGGFGLFSVRERLTALGGSMTISARLGEGTRIELAVPLDPAVEPRAVLVGPLPAPHDHRDRDGTPATEGPMRIVVVDDHAIVREGIARILTTDDRLAVVGEAECGLEAIAAVDRLRPDVVLLDVNMPRMNGVEAAREIRHRWPETVVIGMSVQGDDTTAQSMLDAGATAFIPKAGDSRGMIDTILGVGVGR